MFYKDVEKIYNQVQPDFQTMSLATVHRNVIFLKSIDEILELEFPDRSSHEF
jgi:Fe2+ or Zn2+ uptake regulation protein